MGYSFNKETRFGHRAQFVAVILRIYLELA